MSIIGIILLILLFVAFLTGHVSLLGFILLLIIILLLL